MARPQKFRHSLEALNDAPIAEKLGRLVLDVEKLREKRKQIDDQIAAAFDAVDDAGFDKKFVRKVIALRAKDGDVRRDEEDGIEAYEFAVEKGVSLARVRRNAVSGEQIDPLTGEFLDDAPVTIIDQTDADGHHIKVTVDPEIAAILARVEVERSAAGLDIDGSVASKESRADGGANIVTKHTEIATASQGEAVVHSAEAETSGANEGGEDVESSVERAGLEGGPVNLEPTGPVAEWAAPGETGMVLGTGKERPLSVGLHTDDDPEARFETASLHQKSEPDDGIRYEASPPMPMKSLPYAACFPELTKVEYDALTSVIRLQGVMEPIVRMGDVIVNGWNRYNIARSLGIEYPVVSYLGNDVLLDVIRWQREDRAWTSAQEQKIAARLAKEVPHRASDIMRAFQIEEEFA